MPLKGRAETTFRTIVADYLPELSGVQHLNRRLNISTNSAITRLAAARQSNSYASRIVLGVMFRVYEYHLADQRRNITVVFHRRVPRFGDGDTQNGGQTFTTRNLVICRQTHAGVGRHRGHN